MRQKNMKIAVTDRSWTVKKQLNNDKSNRACGDKQCLKLPERIEPEK
jgi:hypothetical protein